MVFEVNESTTAKIVATFRDENGDLIATLESLTMTLFDAVSGTVINGRNATSVLANFSAGTLTLFLTPEDNTPLSVIPSEPTKHKLLFEFSYGGGKKSSKTEEIFIYYVENKH